MKPTTTLLILSLASTHANDLIIWREQIDTRPFLVRLVLSVGLAFEVGSEKARLKVDREGARAAAIVKESLTVADLFPNGCAVTVKFGAEF